MEFLGWLRALMADGSAGLRTRLDSIAQRITPDTAAAELTALPFFPSTESSSAAPDDPLCLGCLLKLKDDLRLLGMPA